VPQNYGKAAEWIQKSADQGSADAQYNMGMLYHYGDGVPQNNSKAIEWLIKAARQGQPKAQEKLMRVGIRW
jgi:hypothetical protein